MDAAIIEKEALQLPEAERAVLVERLVASLSRTSSEIREAWVRESEDRIKAFQEGKIAAVDGPEAMADLRSRFGK